MYVYMSAGVYRSQKRAPDPLGLKLYAIVNFPIRALRLKLRSSARAGCTVNC